MTDRMLDAMTGAIFETELGRYLRETGTTQTWLAEQVFASRSKVNRWCSAWTGMSDEDKRRVLSVLRERAALDLAGLFDDMPDLGVASS